MLKRFFFAIVLIVALGTQAEAQQQQLIVRTESGLLGLNVIKSACLKAGCTVRQTLDGNVSQLFMVSVNETTTTSSGGLLGGLLGTVGNLLDVVLKLLSQPGIESVEPDLTLRLSGASRSGSEDPEVPAGLYDRTEVNYYGAPARRGYVMQPAVQIVGLDDARRAYNVTGKGVVAIIDTGVDPTHPALARVLLTGYDFTRNREGGSELGDVNQSTAAMLDGSGDAYANQSTAAMLDESKAAYVNQSTAAMLDQSTAAMLDSPEYAAFGHGTMVAGVVHLVAPTAKILPLKAFGADGSGRTSDILRAIYFASQNGADVINMSFSFTTYSAELDRAIKYAARRDIIMVSSTGNSGKRTVVYPAGLAEVVGVASTSNRDYRSTFSNYGSQIVWIAAPGEGIITTYPFGRYAASWGTSFSTPFAAGTGALLLQVKDLNEAQAARAMSNARWVGLEMGYGRLDVFRSVQYWRVLAGIF